MAEDRTQQPLESAGTLIPRSPAPGESHVATAWARPGCVVGLGASAGGLEALEKFFNHVPPDTGMAFVVIQHLSPDFRSLMDELLARHTKLAIHRVEDAMLIEPNAIYLIPPKKEMIVSGGRLLLTDKDPSQGLTLPIDIFFRSLAQECGSRSVGVILSGTGSDGSRGIRAIHEAGGLVIVQDEDTAKFDGMPKSACDTGVVDLVLPPEAMPEALLRWMKHPLLKPEGDGELAGAVTVDGLGEIFRLLRGEYGIDFSHYKPSTVSRRIERRLMLNQCLDLDHYVQQLCHDPGELNSLYKDLLIGVTKFFRDHEAFDRLQVEAIRPLLLKLRPEDEFRVWCAGCATGEEAYSLAVLIQEEIEAMRRPINVKIFATDVHRASLDFASAGVYPEVAFSEVAAARLDRFFARQGHGYQVTPELRKMIVFAPHNVLRDAPFTKLDLVVCRNLLIYLQPLAQKKVLSLFHFALKAGGVLFLGPSESPAEIADEFDALEEHWKIFRKRRDVRLPTDMRLPTTTWYTQTRPGSPRPSLLPSGLADMRLLRAYDALLDQFMPPSLLVNERGELVHTFSGAGKWLSAPDGRPSLEVLDLVDKELKPALAGGMQRAIKDAAPVVFTGIRHKTPHGGEESLRLTVQPIVCRDAESAYLLISLEPAAARALPPPTEHAEIELAQVSRDQLDNLQNELRYTKENLQATIEELETSNEELQATNEELVASNEELQSTNEELHSVNEELYTVNAEYQRKIAELTELTDDMDNLLRSTDIGTIFLDRNLCIRKFTPRIAETFHILPQDMGRRIDSFSYTIDYPHLVADIEHVMGTGDRVDKEVADRRGNRFLLRILPYRAKRGIEGVVLTLIDISPLKQAENELRLMSKVFMDGADPIVIEDLEGRIIDLNAEAERVYGWRREELLGKSKQILLADEVVQSSEALRERCRKNDHVRNVESLRKNRDGRSIPVLLTMSLLTDGQQQPCAIATIAKDNTESKRLEAERQRYAAELESNNRALRENVVFRQKAEEVAQDALRRRDHFLAMLSHELRNPLSAVLNATYVLDRDHTEEPLRRQARSVIQRQGRQMARLLDDLLDVSRITQNKIEIRRETVNLLTTVEDAVQAVRPLAEARNQQLILELPSDALYVYGDPSRLQQIQVNLLTNAVKYTPPGGRIWLSASQQDEEVVLTVRDTGRGIPADMLETIFELFVQGGAALDRNDGGMGVGLTLVRSMVQMHGGTVQAQSPGPGQGSTFTIRLPLSHEPKLKPSDPQPAIAVAEGVKILIVEDNADSRQMLQMLLELDGYCVHVAEDGQKGLEALRSQRYDVALVDIGLPVMDGYQLAREIRADKATHDLYLVALTGYGRPSDRQAVLEAGFDEHLVKPLRSGELLRVLARVRTQER